MMSTTLTGVAPPPVTAVESAKIPTVDYARLLELLHGEYSATLLDRHAAAIARVCRVHGNGFPLRDLQDVMKLVEYAYAKTREGYPDVFESCLCDAMQTMAKPFVKHTCTDEVRSYRTIEATLEMIARLLNLENAPVSARILAAEALRAFASAHGTRPDKIDVDAEMFDAKGRANAAASLGASLGGLGSAPKVSPHHQFFTNQRLVRGSEACVPQLVSGLGRATSERAPDAELQLAIAKALLEASHYDKNAQSMAAHGLFANIVPLVKNITDMKSPFAPVVSELMWNALEASPGAKVLPYGGWRPFCVHLSDFIALAVRQSHGCAHKEIRNELLIIARVMAEEPDTRAGLRACGLAAVALEMAVHPENGQRANELVLPVFAQTTSAEDFQMKRFAWTLTTTLAEDTQGIAVAKSGFIECLLTFLRPLTGEYVPPPLTLPSSNSDTGVNRWGPERLRDLQELALRLLARLAPLCPNEMIAGGACDAVVQIARVDSPADDFLRAAALDLGAKLATLDGFKDVLGEFGAVEAALSAFEGVDRLGRASSNAYASSYDGGSRGESRYYGAEETAGGAGTLYGGAETAPLRPSVSEDPVKLGAAGLLSVLCHEHAVNARYLRKADGINILKAAVDAMANTDKAVPINFGAAALTAVWKCVVPDAKNCAHFIAGGGMESLLNLLSRCNANLRPVTLSLLADVLENPKTHLFFHEWRSTGGSRSLVPAGASATTLVLNVWRSAEAALGVTNGDGVIANRANPLAGDSSKSRPFDEAEAISGATYTVLTRGRLENEVKAAAAAKRDGADGLMSRVFAVCSLLGFGNLREYCGRVDELTLFTVERYVDFKEGEVWERTKEIFENEGLVPTGPDRQVMDEAIVTARMTAAELADAQRSIVNGDTRKATAEEVAYYEEKSTQAAADEAARWYKPDRSKLTTKERYRSQLLKDTMLSNSFKAPTRQSSLLLPGV